MIIYLFITGIIGVITLLVSTAQMAVSYDYGFNDEEFQLGAVGFALSLIAPISIPLILVGVFVFGCVVAYKGCAELVKEIMEDRK